MGNKLTHRSNYPPVMEDPKDRGALKRPFVSRELLEYLDRIFKNQCPHIDDTDRQIWTAVGARNVVEHLRSIHAAQLKENL